MIATPARRSRLLPAAAILVVGIATLVLVSQRRHGATSTPVTTGALFIGSARCASCHAPQYTAWKSSQHAAAMQDARTETVLGRFDGTRFTHNGVTTSFRRDGARFVVNTEGPDGALHDYDVRYTFGLWPLQQYLLELPGGRLQPLRVAWDARPVTGGGQRWYSLDGDERVAAGDALHWTGRALNWNYMCADCHSTGVRKGYDARTDTFRTTFAEVNVACEACHGPGSAHAAWGARPAWVRRYVWRANGLATALNERRGVRWSSVDSTTGNAVRTVPRTTDREIETCAQCHARRAHIADGYTAGARLNDFYDPTPLLPELYHPDGQQQDEVYTYGSFLQSRMYAFGVTCADCHDPHTQKLRQPGNLVCTQCHRAATYDATLHHGHALGSAGAACAACHMPTATFMGIDARHDHSLRVPRPDRTSAMGVPNACNQCHTDRTPAWAAQQIGARAGKSPGGFQRFAEAFAAADAGTAQGPDSLAVIVNDATYPAIVRASALARLRAYPGARALQVAAAGARDRSPLVRRWALDALWAFPPRERVGVAAPLLGDSARAIRQEAAALLVAVADSLTPHERRAFDSASGEFVASQRYNADRAEARTRLGVFYIDGGRLDSAAAEFQTVVAQWPRFVDGYVNLAGVLSLQKRESEGERVLREGLHALPAEPRLHHALGLSLARAGRLNEATAELAEADRLASHDPEFAYPFAVALHGTGRIQEAIRVLTASRKAFPGDRNVLYALSTFLRDAGDPASALRYAIELARAYPDDEQARALVGALQVPAR